MVVAVLGMVFFFMGMILPRLRVGVLGEPRLRVGVLGGLAYASGFWGSLAYASGFCREARLRVGFLGEPRLRVGFLAEARLRVGFSWGVLWLGHSACGHSYIMLLCRFRPGVQAVF